MKKALARKLRGRTLDAQVADFKAHGFSERQIYVVGRGAESIETCIASFRGQPGEMYIAADMRVFGSSKKEIEAAASLLESAAIKLFDIFHPEDGDKMWRMVSRGTRAAVFDKRWAGDKHKARAVGAIGGRKRAENLKMLRMPVELAGPIWGNTNLLIAERLHLMNPKTYKRQWTAPSARRHLASYVEN